MSTEREPVDALPAWLGPGLDYCLSWFAFQQRSADLPGLQLAIAREGRIVRRLALGRASIATGAPLTHRHRLRVASHSKTFTAVAILRLVEAGRLRLDDPVGRHVAGLHPTTAQASIAQLLTHTAGVTRDGADGGQWQNLRPFRGRDELIADLALAPVLEANTRLKYSNHGYGLLGLVVAAVTGEPYADWVDANVVKAAGLRDTSVDAPVAAGVPLADGHGSALLLGTRFAVPMDQPTHALAPATGFVSTASDLARFFAALAPGARSSLLSVASRRELVRRQWPVPDTSFERHYGLGVMQGGEGDWAWFGHSGVFPGCQSHTAVLPRHGLAISLVLNAVDLAPATLVDGAIDILRQFAAHPSPRGAAARWQGRWWSHWSVSDLVAFGDRVLVAVPGQLNPFADAVVIGAIDGDAGLIERAGGFLSHGEPARLVRDARGRPRELWLGGSRLLPEAAAAREVRAKYARPRDA